MYRKIAEHPTTREIYGKRLERDGLIELGAADRMVERLQQGLDQEYEASAGYKPNKADWLEGQWAGLQVASGDDRRGSTAVEFDLLKEVDRKSTRLNSSHYCA